MNELFDGNNLNDLRKLVRDEIVDLCYIDPPFSFKITTNRFTAADILIVGIFDIRLS